MPDQARDASDGHRSRQLRPQLPSVVLFETSHHQSFVTNIRNWALADVAKAGCRVRDIRKLRFHRESGCPKRPEIGTLS